MCRRLQAVDVGHVLACVFVFRTAALHCPYHQKHGDSLCFHGSDNVEPLSSITKNMFQYMPYIHRLQPPFTMNKMRS